MNCFFPVSYSGAASLLRGDTTSFPRDDQPQLLHEVLEAALRKDPSLGSQKALILSLDGSTTTSINFDELNAKSDVLSSKISKAIPSTLFTSPDEDNQFIVAVCLHHSIELVVGLLAILKAGAAYLPIDPSFPPDRVAHILNNAQPQLLLSTESIAQVLISTADVKIPVLDVTAMHESYVEPPPRVYTEMEKKNRLAVVLYTSGSSGTPKGVKIEHRSILHRLQWQWDKFPYDDEYGEMGCFKTALTFVDSIPEIWAPLLNGRPLMIVPRMIVQDTQRFVELLDSSRRIGRIFVVPSQLRAILDYLKSMGAEKELRHIKMWICSGEALTPELANAFFDYFDEDTSICNFYGSTEVTGDVTYSVFGSREELISSLVENKVPLGKALDDCNIYLLKDNGFRNSGKPSLVKPGCIGEIYVAGSHVTAGYIGGDKTFENRFISNHIENKNGYEILYRTGDYGRIVNGQLYYEGRSDSQVKVRGHRVDLSEINVALNHLTDYVSKSVVLCYNGQRGQEILAFVVTRQAGCTDKIVQQLRTKLNSYMIPKIVPVEQLPLLVNGKIDRQGLLRSYEKQYTTRGSTNEIEKGSITVTREEKALIETIASVVGTANSQTIKLSSNFFEIGGNSLNAVTVVTMLRDQGFSIDVTTFLGAARLEDLVTQMAATIQTPIDACEIIEQQQLLADDYLVEPISDDNKEDVIRIICKSFSMEDNPCLPMSSKVKYADYEKLLRIIWDDLLEANLSFAVRERETNKVVSVSLNFDAASEPRIKENDVGKALHYVIDYLSQIEDPIREKLLSSAPLHNENRTGYLVHGYMMAATADKSNPARNVQLMHKMELDLLDLARRRGYSGVFTTNSNELTRQICTDLLGYNVEKTIRIKDFRASDGSMPFADAPECWKAAVSSMFF